MDENFLEALSSGLPECSGVALGIDRLVMLALNVSHIDNVISFSYRKGVNLKIYITFTNVILYQL